MNREPVNPDDPQMTAYLLGELNAAETAEYESRLQDSPMARRELAAMREMMQLLGAGLRQEWEEECAKPVLKLVPPAPVSAAGDAVVAVNFRPRRLRLAMAAGLAAMLLAGVAILPNRPRESAGSGDLVSAGTPAALPHVPKLFLAEEVEDLSSLDLAGDFEAADPAIDASYLDADAVIPASFQPSSPVVRSHTAERGAFDRVDSYLPPVGGIIPGRSTTGMIERRLGRGVGEPGSGSTKVLVSGYVTMDGGTNAILRGGFRPVSISGNPVVNEKSDLRLLADLNGLQRELSEVIGSLPQQSEKRADLERILERSRRLVSQLELDLKR